MSYPLLEQLITKINNEGGAISFVDYMQEALYAPQLGYYSATQKKIGAKGDFITAPEISPLFSQCLARQCQQILAKIPEGSILEFGAGTGIMASEILLSLEKSASLPKYYYILELSASLRFEQEQTIKTRCPQHLARVIWLNRLPQFPFNGIVLANEVLDAMPVHLIHFENNECLEKVVGFDGEKLQWLQNPIKNSRLEKQVDKISAYLPAKIRAQGYTTEVNLYLAPWIKSIGEFLNKGLILLIDYGYPRHEYYHPARSEGTLMCYYQHKAHSNPLAYPGLQDITAHVDFTELAEAAIQAQLDLAAYTHQGAFLLSCGLLDLIPEGLSAALQFSYAEQVKQLTLSMGELFKVIALTKNWDEPLLGFQMDDRRYSLYTHYLSACDV